MKRILLTLTLLSLISSVALSQGVVRREKKKDKTEQTTRSQRQKPSSSKPQATKPAVRKPERKKPDVKVSEPDGYINGHGYVDLGLPSGTKWATCNVGASSPEGYGYYYAWGETSPKSSYTYSNSLTNNKSLADLKSAGIIGSDGNLTPSHDAASANWGSLWRMPTKEEMEELKEKCQWMMIRRGGNLDFRVIGPNGKSIWFPLPGRVEGALDSPGQPGHTGSHGHYFTSTAMRGNDYVESNFITIDGPHVMCGYRVFGGSIRPVLK